MRRTPFLTVVALVMSLVLAAPASADLFTDVVNDYIKDSRLDVCKYTQDQLKKIKDAVPVDQNAYTPEFIAAVDDAIARRAEGACNTKKVTQALTQTPAAPSGGGPTTTPSAGHRAARAVPGQPAAVQPPPQPTADPTPAPQIATDAISVAARATASGGDAPAPFPVLALALLAGLLGLGGLLVGLGRWRVWEPDWVDRMRHATGEAGWRAASTWAEFTDFVRFGR
jgi:hypothetical protein